MQNLNNMNLSRRWDSNNSPYLCRVHSDRMEKPERTPLEGEVSNPWGAQY